ncbi:MAG: response regulator transcription factor [Nitrospira sp.]
MSVMQNQECWMEKIEGVRRPIRVLVIDRSSLTLQGLKGLFSKSHHIEVVGMASTRQEALRALEVEHPDLVLVEVRVGQDSGIELCRTIRDSHPQVRVLFFTTQDDKDILRSAIVAGAHGYLLKSATAESITRSIEIVAGGRAIMDQQLTDQLISWIRDGSDPGLARRSEACSREERHLLSLVASGKTNKEIGQELKLAPTVVASRLQKIYKRLRISRRSEAARYYIDLEQKSQSGPEPFHHES